MIIRIDKRKEINFYNQMSKQSNTAQIQII